MFHYIKGIVTMKFDGGVVLESNGIGYEIFVADTSSPYLAESNNMILLYTAMIVREDDVSIYGFPEKDSLDLFRKLMTVTGIGAKAAISILSSMPAGEVIKAIVFEDIATLTKANGIGKKTAQRMILELKDKLSTLNPTMDSPMMETSDNMRTEAMNGLISLGYSKSEAMEALIGIHDDNLTTEEYIKRALKGSFRK